MTIRIPVRLEAKAEQTDHGYAPALVIWGAQVWRGDERFDSEAEAKSQAAAHAMRKLYGSAWPKLA